MDIAYNIQKIKDTLPETAKLVAVSKIQPVNAITDAYVMGQRDFGENYIQELQEKQAVLPQDIRWHFIGHLQSNKVKYIAPYVHLIHGVDSLKLLKEISKQAKKHNRVISCLLQIHIAEEDTKFGLSADELFEILRNPALLELEQVEIIGLMGMASFTDDTNQIDKEFKEINKLFQLVQSSNGLNINLQKFKELSIGMSSDYLIALQNGSTMVRVGSSIFGERKKQ